MGLDVSYSLQCAISCDGIEYDAELDNILGLVGVPVDVAMKRFSDRLYHKGLLTLQIEVDADLPSRFSTMSMDWMLLDLALGKNDLVGNPDD